MREILFRGKAANRIEGYEYRTNYKNGDWVYGLLIEVENYAGFSVMANTDGIVGIEVDKQTIGQYTGLTCKNGKIFEGDIFQTDDGCIEVVVFDKGCFELQKWGICDADTENGYIEHGGGWGIVMHVPFGWYYIGNMEVIGNIHDNPELLKESS